MMAERILLKLGGSVITDKAGNGNVKKDVLSYIADIIAGYTRMHQIVIVHGAGGYGHPEAHQYGIQEGVSVTNRAGIYHTHHAVASLNEMVVSSLREKGIEAVGIHPLHGCLADNQRLISYPTEQIDQMVRMGIIPVLHGDVVMDITRGACIISGDQLVQVYARELKIDRVGLATDVPGLLGQDGSVMRKVSVKQITTIDIGTSKATDVTGGMRGKIDELAALASAGIASEIFHISKISEFLSGSDHEGTCISREL